MSKESVLIRMQEVIKDILDLDQLELNRELTAQDIDGWDSLAHINIVVGIEREFKCKFSLAEVKKLKCIGDFVDLIETKQ